MTDQGLSLDSSQETRIVVQALKIERLEEKNSDLNERVRVLERNVYGASAVIAAAITVIGFATNISKAYL
tara:strand:+ start:750 stop:959 length:210 start_codon:yes stop_codon:yes gene_type:complete